MSRRARCAHRRRAAPAEAPLEPPICPCSFPLPSFSLLLPFSSFAQPLCLSVTRPPPDTAPSPTSPTSSTSGSGHSPTPCTPAPPVSLPPASPNPRAPSQRQLHHAEDACNRRSDFSSLQESSIPILLSSAASKRPCASPDEPLLEADVVAWFGCCHTYFFVQIQGTCSVYGSKLQVCTLLPSMGIAGGRNTRRKEKRKLHMIQLTTCTRVRDLPPLS
ncbi:hypothetical protein VPH35_101976 [Triticum aestivum]